ncbi:CDP-glycerol glycerophosphotransferase family protein, partial [Siminovitchia fortis]|uniref:CDP-glycerol glycerophosphotransferase family protein n=1 Tax=Siminovitchia fortis TaxID=254758 RepID=UPI0036F341DF
MHIHLHTLKKQFANHYLIFLTLHYLLSQNLHFSPIQPFLFHLSSYPHIPHFYLISHLLLTHYSSLFFHSPNLNPPIIFFLHHIQHYPHHL